MSHNVQAANLRQDFLERTWLKKCSSRTFRSKKPQKTGLINSQEYTEQAWVYEYNFEMHCHLVSRGATIVGQGNVHTAQLNSAPTDSVQILYEGLFRFDRR